MLLGCPMTNIGPPYNDKLTNPMLIIAYILALAAT